jgi:hypothetical protein
MIITRGYGQGTGLITRGYGWVMRIANVRAYMVARRKLTLLSEGLRPRKIDPGKVTLIKREEIRCQAI